MIHVFSLEGIPFSLVVVMGEVTCYGMRTCADMEGNEKKDVLMILETFIST